MCWLRNISHHLLCPTYTMLDYSGNQLLYQGKLMFLWSFYIHVLKNKQSGWPCVPASFAEGRKANEKWRSWAWPQLWKLFHMSKSFHFCWMVPSFWLGWAICSWLCCQVLRWTGFLLLMVFPTWMFLYLLVFEYWTELQILMLIS